MDKQLKTVFAMTSTIFLDVHEEPLTPVAGALHAGLILVNAAPNQDP